MQLLLGEIRVVCVIRWGNLRKRENLEDEGVHWMIIIRWTFRNWVMRAWTGLIWLRIGSVCGHM
jgi:hypothetical protein